MYWSSLLLPRTYSCIQQSHTSLAELACRGFRAKRCMRLPRNRHTVAHHKQPAPAALAGEAQDRRTLRARIVKYLEGLVQRLAKEQAQAIVMHTKGSSRILQASSMRTCITLTKDAAPSR